jgi:small basic protein (TIGR04137 family)
MSMDRSLKMHGGLVRTRCVLSRAERIAQLTDEGKFDPDRNSPLGLPKVKVKHSRAGTKTKKAAEEVAAEGVEGAVPAEGAAPAPGAAPAKGAAAAKGAVPAKGAAPAKGEAKAAKGEAKAERKK